MSYDIIGDIHGQADKLRGLLHFLGYREKGGCYRHPTRTAVFVGDFIDRGPRQLATLRVVRSMVDGGHALAVMGNHEFNAIAWHTPDPDQPGAFLRTHDGARGAVNRSQHAAFLKEVERRPKVHAEIIDWFLTLPLWIETAGIRVVHACWHPSSMEMLAPALGQGNVLTRDLIPLVNRNGSEECRAAEILTKGMEAPLPGGRVLHDKDGHARGEARIRWWSRPSASWREACLVPEAVCAELPDTPVPDHLVTGCAGDGPVFFGHYWFEGVPRILGPRAACVDYSAGKGGPLVAYRWEGERELRNESLVAF